MGEEGAMARTAIGDGVVVDAPSGLRLNLPGDTGFGISSDADGPQADVLAGALQNAKFTVAADFELHGTAEVPLGVDAEIAAPATVEVTVQPNESALLLVERDGVYAWAFPKARMAAESVGFAEGGPDKLIFLVGPAPQTGAALSLDDFSANSVWNWLVKRAIGGLRARVLKFAVGTIINATVDHVEGHLVPGLAPLAGDDPSQWRAGQAILPIQPRNAGQPVRVLLMVHGTFSTTEGSFGQLTNCPEGLAFLASARAKYDAIIGFDHKTLAESPETNALNMLQALEQLGLPQGTELDAVAYSRGGLVYRQFAETLLPVSRPDIKVGKAIFVGCTNRGTNLAEPKNWQTMVDLYTNCAMAGARAVAYLTGHAAWAPAITETLQTLGQFVQFFSTVAITENQVPGLAAMRPSSAIVTQLNSAKDNANPKPSYYAVTSNFVAIFDVQKGVTKELAQLVFDKVTNRLFGDDNDLVVDTTSMTTFGELKDRLLATHTYAFGDQEDVFHTVYFKTPSTATHLSNWLI